MADMVGLRRLGMTYGGITLAVTLVAAFVVVAHWDGPFAFDDPAAPAIVATVSR